MEKTEEKEGIRATSADRVLSITKNQTPSTSNKENNIPSEEEGEEEQKYFLHTLAQTQSLQPLNSSRNRE